MELDSAESAWMVRAGNDNELVDQFWNQKLVAVGWKAIDDISSLSSRSGVKEMYKEAYPEHSRYRRDTNAGQLFRFAHEIIQGDYVVSYVKSEQEYLAGCINGPYQYRSDSPDVQYPHIRPVNWIARLPRDVFSEPARRSLRSPLTVFSLDDYVDEIYSLLVGTNSTENDRT